MESSFSTWKWAIVLALVALLLVFAIYDARKDRTLTPWLDRIRVVWQAAWLAVSVWLCAVDYDARTPDGAETCTKLVIDEGVVTCERWEVKP